jgi:hypothetical protein
MAIGGKALEIPAHIAGKVGLAVGWPSGGRPIAPYVALSYLNLTWPFGWNRVSFASHGTKIDLARNEMAEAALEAGTSYLLFLDDDVEVPQDGLRMLFETMENAPADVMIVAGIYCAKEQSSSPVVFREEGRGPFWKWKVGDIFECGVIGAGCMLIKSEVFKHLEKPWFRTIDSALFQQNEDSYFCQKVRAAGFKILADSRVVCTHWGWDGKVFSPYTLPADSYPLRSVSDSP